MTNNNDPILVTVKETPDGLVMSLAQPTDSEPHQTLSAARGADSLPDASEIAPGVTLATRDGLQIGNAIVIQEVQPRTSLIKDLLAAKDQKFWLIETDFGNRCRLSDGEINQLFVLGKQNNYDCWWDDRATTIQASLQKDFGNDDSNRQR